MTNPVAQRFSENLIRLRTDAGLSQEALGFVAGMNRTQVGILERRERLPRIDTLVRLSGALRVSPNDLLAGIVWNTAQIEINTGGFEIGEGEEEREQG
ncbi:MAG TPA: helix-turn-helix transcriptional regulator [Solirubrobacterales bacterium]|nr:helix-turn-helix transcriptional regulator [Solirubrobacterales bacterium]